MRGRIISKRFDLRQPIECRLHDTTLNAAATSVNHADLMEPGFGSRGDVLFDDRRDVARREGMQIELALDRYFHFLYSAVTTVLIPPRTEKSPTTVMRRGWMAATRSSRIWLVTDS